MTELIFRSSDNRYGLHLPPPIVNDLLSRCREAKMLETGGILVGRYNPNHDWAIVSMVSDAPADSRRGPTWFERGVTGLQRWLNGLWRQREYYLGEWHFHPGGPPSPSSTDLSQMQEIADAESYHCPEPILLIIGGDPRGSWTARSLVCLSSGATIELVETQVPVQ
jgi:integrative and conjugative element protein (TIGR02256 family)